MDRNKKQHIFTVVKPTVILLFPQYCRYLANCEFAKLLAFLFVHRCRLIPYLQTKQDFCEFSKHFKIFGDSQLSQVLKKMLSRWKVMFFL